MLKVEKKNPFCCTVRHTLHTPYPHHCSLQSNLYILGYLSQLSLLPYSEKTNSRYFWFFS